MKCNTCKYEKYCDSYCFDFEYDPSIRKLIAKKINDKIIKLFRLM